MALRELRDATLAGGSYGFTAAVLSHPLDTLKTRAQLSRPHSTGISALYQGFVPAATGSVLFRAVPFVAYGVGTARIREGFPLFAEAHPLPVAAAAGSFAGLVRALLESPLEVIKVRRQAARLGSRYEAWSSTPLWAGVGWCAVRNASLIGLFWVTLEASKESLAAALPGPVAVSFVGGGGCSVVAWAVAYPLDVLKSRAQAASEPASGGSCEAGDPKARTAGWGFRGLYRGLGFGLARTFVANGAAMVIYDAVRDALLCQPPPPE